MNQCYRWKWKIGSFNICFHLCIICYLWVVNCPLLRCTYKESFVVVVYWSLIVPNNDIESKSLYFPHPTISMFNVHVLCIREGAFNICKNHRNHHQLSNRICFCVEMKWIIHDNIIVICDGLHWKYDNKFRNLNSHN